MKRIVGLVLSAALLLPCISPNAQDIAVEADKTETGIVVKHNDNGAKTAVIAFYVDDVLSYCDMSDISDGAYSFEVPDEFLDKKARISYMGGEIFDVEVKAGAAQTPAPSAEPSTPTPTPYPTRKPVPPAYEKEADAMNAYAVVDKYTATQIDGENYYELQMYYQGNHVSTKIKESVVISEAPRIAAGLNGQNVSALRSGDIIHFTANMSGSVRTVEFIHRPEFEDYVNGDLKFDLLISGYRPRNDQYVFGVPVKVRNKTMLLADKDGKTMDITASDNTIVYSVTRTGKGRNVDVLGTGMSCVAPVYVSNELFDGDDNVTSWADVPVDRYVFVRVVDGTATEITVFEY